MVFRRHPKNVLKEFYQSSGEDIAHKNDQNHVWIKIESRDDFLNTTEDKIVKARIKSAERTEKTNSIE
jgi:hypothetical protein